MDTNEDIKIKIIKKVFDVIELGNNRLNTNLDGGIVDIKFTLRSTTAGTAYYSWIRCELNFNLNIAKNNLEDFLNDTVPHEVTHLFQSKLYPHAKDHGNEFYRIGSMLGYNLTRCHKMNTSEVQRNRVKRFIWACNKCGKNFKVTKNMHENISLFGCKCPKCKVGIKYSHMEIV